MSAYQAKKASLLHQNIDQARHYWHNLNREYQEMSQWLLDSDGNRIPEISMISYKNSELVYSLYCLFLLKYKYVTYMMIQSSVLVLFNSTMPKMARIWERYFSNTHINPITNSVDGCLVIASYCFIFKQELLWSKEGVYLERLICR